MNGFTLKADRTNWKYYRNLSYPVAFIYVAKDIVR